MHSADRVCGTRTSSKCIGTNACVHMPPTALVRVDKHLLAHQPQWPAPPSSAEAPPIAVDDRDGRVNCYVINLPGDRERRQRIETLFRGHGLEYTIIEAVNGKDLSPGELAFLRHYAEIHLLPAELGCMMSHIKCWRAFLDSDAETALVCEDDIHVSGQLKNCVRRVRFPAGEKSVVRLESFGSFATFGVKPIQTLGKYRVHPMLTDHGGTACYMINRATARHLIESAPNFRNAIDIEMFFPNRSSIRGLQLLQVIPAPAIQDQILTANNSIGFLRSNMGKERADVKIWNSRSIFQRAKGRARPYYQIAYSLYLRIRRGNMRIIVPFG